jgi:GGDEF domain-containing protein
VVDDATWRVRYAHSHARIDGLVVYLRDLTLQTHAEDAASNTARKYRMLMEQASDGILVMEQRTRRLERANEAVRPYRIALSLGVACEHANDATSRDGLVAQADAALYADKRSRPADRQWQR